MGMSVGERLRRQRQRVGLSLGQVAAYENVSRQYLSRLELGDDEPGAWDLIGRLARRYSTSVDYLLALTDDPSVSAGAVPDFAVDLVEILRKASASRRDEITAIARLLVESEERRREAVDLHGLYMRMLSGLLNDQESAILERALGLFREGRVAEAQRLLDGIVAQRESHHPLQEGRKKVQL